MADNDNSQCVNAQRCPNCDKPSKHEFRPFCSGRCKDVDLAHWLTGSYKIPDRAIDEDNNMPSSGKPQSNS
ncbi:MAG: DNA gyrase inhibitor YacG [Pseudomonadota bacterium]